MPMPACRLVSSLGSCDQLTFPCTRILHRTRKTEDIPAELSNRFGGVQHFVETHTKEALKASGRFGLHSTFVCGEPRIDSESQVK